MKNNLRSITRFSNDLWINLSICGYENICYNVDYGNFVWLKCCHYEFSKVFGYSAWNFYNQLRIMDNCAYKKKPFVIHQNPKFYICYRHF